MIYLDHNATTPVIPEVFAALEPYFHEEWGNPSSSYRFGSKLKIVIEKAREEVADLIGASPTEIIFTSGGTESDNSALQAILRADLTKRHIITSAVEHSAVLEFCKGLEQMGFHITYLPVNSDGLLSIADLETAITSDTAGVSLMWANNETGVLFQVDEIGKLCRDHHLLFHCDAVQAVGKVTIDVQKSHIDYLSLTGHKIGAPKGVGALYVRSKVPFTPLIYGGHQERGQRGGTESVPLIVGLGYAATLAAKNLLDYDGKVRPLRDALENALLDELPTATINGHLKQRLANTSNIHLQGMDSDAVITFLDRADICASSGSACMESAISPSHVITAMTGSHEVANESIRFSFSTTNTLDDVQTTIQKMREFIKVMS